MRECRGLALCAAFSIHDPKGFCPDKWMELDCTVQVNIARTHAVSKTPLNTQMTPTFSMSVPINSLAGTDHIWLFYVSRSYITYNDCFFRSGVSFGDKTDEGITMWAPSSI
ncbi:hypothetical protein Patl1_07272 [Pistacia atlantica]|uniref:Uncharacterized protein n=1 Tax=Pistacia atlantica TaxID=434234 RepID=A0ACC1AIW6_9ROSI|nr:hypothetical protein Patl1_07272 [Pistacia atlantica]